MTIAWSPADKALLDTLNAGSWSRTFSPDKDIDWNSETTSDEFVQLYRVWSLLLGSRHEMRMTDAQRVQFAKYQQMNLMLFTALFERCGLATFETFYGDDDDAQYQEYVTHFIKEETYHYLLFARAIAKIRATDESLRAIPQAHLRFFLNVVNLGFRLLPSRKLRHGMGFFFLRFAEEISLQAHAMAKRTVARDTSLVNRVWALHAIDEARHVVFDDLMMERARLPGMLARVPAFLTVPLCVMASLLLNLNEIWAARQIGVPVGYHELPVLMKRTTATFKRKVFTILGDAFKRDALKHDGGRA